MPIHALLLPGLVTPGVPPAVVEAPHKLRVESLENPQGLDLTAPRLSWLLPAHAAVQTAYQILVAEYPADLTETGATLWNSGKVQSGQTLYVPYKGKPLTSGMRCAWKVRIWDAHDKPSVWSVVADWSMGLLHPEEWKAKWLTSDPPITLKESTGPEERELPAQYFYCTAEIARPVRRATAYFCGLGLSELYINGRKVGDARLSPALSQYDKRARYVTYDVTDLLNDAGHGSPGASPTTRRIGVLLGNGRFHAPRTRVPTETADFGDPKFILQIDVEYADGEVKRILSDANSGWRCAGGPITKNNEYDGEEYDGRYGYPGIDPEPARTYGNSHVVETTAPGAALTAMMSSPIRVTAVLKPLSIKEIRTGVYIIDMGQNISGWCRLTAQGPRGARITLRHAEILTPEGELFTANLRSAKQQDDLVLRGTGAEVWEPRFTIHGFRYVEMTGFPGKPTQANIAGCVVHDDVASAGEFVTSKEILNRISHCIRWGTRDNMRSIPTDCTQRDERQGWVGDRTEGSRGETYLFDVCAFYRKWLQDIRDAQHDNGSLSDVNPAYWPMYFDSVTWPSLYIVVTGMLYQQYGDLGFIADNYEAMSRWMAHMQEYSVDGLLPRDSYGDWCVPPEEMRLIHSEDPNRKTDGTLLGTAGYIHDLHLMAQYAALLHKPQEAADFTLRAKRMTEAFNARYLNREKGIYDNGSQTSCVLPLAFGLVPEEFKATVFAHLVQKIEGECKGHVGTGLMGGQWLMRVLTDNGRIDLAYQLATNTTYPSWGYMVGKGATTVWELWNGDTADPGMNSGNHLMLIGDLNVWMNETLGGLTPVEPGFRRFRLKPRAVGDLSACRITHQSPYGLILSDWKIEGGMFRYRFTVPAGTTAQVYLPAKSDEKVHTVPGLKYLRMEEGYALFDALPGAYELTATE